jgi:hypothetical protein
MKYQREKLSLVVRSKAIEVINANCHMTQFSEPMALR